MKSKNPQSPSHSPIQKSVQRKKPHALPPLEKKALGAIPRSRTPSLSANKSQSFDSSYPDTSPTTCHRVIGSPPPAILRKYNSYHEVTRKEFMSQMTGKETDEDLEEEALDKSYPAIKLSKCPDVKHHIHADSIVNVDLPKPATQEKGPSLGPRTDSVLSIQSVASLGSFFGADLNRSVGRNSFMRSTLSPPPRLISCKNGDVVQAVQEWTLNEANNNYTCDDWPAEKQSHPTVMSAQPMRLKKVSPLVEKNSVNHAILPNKYAPLDPIKKRGN